ncbi:hypothetical protein CERSUDRAFT_66005 [Gelatoporia subvermispora B]|uniref:Uncharacterized protein n=1 Tax=Ceriporiopsis subvermispora (strain B) TaxID=914234 RepID=M2QW86_CERS8|nr:hypothetical protein CERSUDRAFT_66005 [Gelatoporia subvermispora B]
MISRGPRCCACAIRRGDEDLAVGLEANVECEGAELDAGCGADESRANGKSLASKLGVRVFLRIDSPCRVTRSAPQKFGTYSEDGNAVDVPPCADGVEYDSIALGYSCDCRCSPSKNLDTLCEFGLCPAMSGSASVEMQRITHMVDLSLPSRALRDLNRVARYPP